MLCDARLFSHVINLSTAWSIQVSHAYMFYFKICSLVSQYDFVLKKVGLNIKAAVKCEK